jgi:DNA-3-methyladenine glycosylase I
MSIIKQRCNWVDLNSEIYVKYHDEEWGIPVYDDYKLFEFLILESAQAGLSWITILKKREFYRQAYLNFDFNKVAKFNSKDIFTLINNKSIIRNKLKIEASINNAKIFLKIRSEYKTFSNYIWSFVDNKPIVNGYKSYKVVPSKTHLSDLISLDLNAKGMKFLGPVIIYSFMQAVGIVNDHEVDCFRYKEVKKYNKHLI